MSPNISIMLMISVTYMSETQHSLIATAASDGHLGMARVLLDMTEEDVHCIALYDHVPLLHAASHGKLEILKYFDRGWCRSHSDRQSRGKYPFPCRARRPYRDITFPLGH